MANYDYVISTGVVVPDTADIRSEVEAEWRTAFGQDLPVDPETPQGVMITMETESRDALVRNNAEVANQINPDISGGIWLDAIWSLTGGSRMGATRSRLNGVEFRGIANTLIPAGSIATVSPSGERFRTLVNILLDGTGFATSTMEAVDTGPVSASAGALNEVASSVLGWEQVYNPSDAVLGQVVESDVSSRRRRRQTLALQSNGSPEAIISRLYDTEGVRSLSFRENITNATITIDGISIPGHYIYACVEGGSDSEVANALFQSKAVGPGYTGSITVPVTDQFSGQTYDVKFDRPVERTFQARFTVKSSTLDALNIIQNAVQSYVNGELEGDAGLVVNQNLSPFELAGAVNIVEPRIFITRVELSTDGLTWSTAEITIKLNEVARLPKSAVQVVII